MFCFKLWLLVLICKCSAGAEISAQSCEDFTSLVGNWSIFGSRFVCGASRVGTCSDSYCCPDTRGQTWQQAQALCARIGMRLCTGSELTSNEATGTGCGADVLNVWTSDECSSTYAFSQCGSSECLDSLPSTCLLKSDLLRTRCCADARSACRSRPCGDVKNLCYPSSATTYTCRCFAPYSLSADSRSCIAPTLCQNEECATDKEPLNRCIDLRNGSYSCVCAPTWSLTQDGRTCAPPFDPCLRNPCQRTAANRNVCTSFANGSYTCICNSNGWLLGRTPDRQLDVCVEVTSVCTNNTSCNYRSDPTNMCIDLRDGAFACECKGAQWKPTRNRQACIRKQCLNDPCDSFQDPLNVCRENGEFYNCTCNPRFWRHAVGREACIPIRDPCDDDPCRVQESEEINVCTNRYNSDRNTNNNNVENGGVGLNSTYTCSCLGARYRLVIRDNQQFCTYMPDMCVANNYPCSELLDNGNRCEDNMNGSYTCVCRGRGFYSNANNTRCLERPSACINRPCGENITGANICNDRRDGTYTCTCNTRGWQLQLTADNLQICVPPPNPCLDRNNPCATAQNGNICVDRLDSTYYCICNARGWITPFGSQSCVPPATQQPTIVRVVANPCSRGDPCSRFRDPANACIDLSGVANSVAPFYRCDCHVTRGWTQGPNNTRCIQPVNRCRMLTDPCNNTANPLNRCADLGDATYECSCGGPAWRTGPGKQSCLPPLNMCNVSNDFCRTVGNLDNICIDLGSATYRCVCNQRGFTSTSNGQFCRELPNPCASRPCGAQVLNTCTRGVADSYTCTCRAPGWQTAAGARRCIPPTNACLNRDPCKTFQNRYNRCEENADGTYFCVCAGRGWQPASPTNSQTCIPPDNACRPANRTRFDPCLNLVHPRNYCVDNEDGTYRCACRAPLYTTGLAEQSCICPDPCAVSDPCYTSEEPLNSCYIKFNSTVQLASPLSCYWHGCICGNGWRLYIDSSQNERCLPPDPCIVGDKCSSQADPLNECVSVYQPPAPIFQIVNSQSVDYPVYNPPITNLPIFPSTTILPPATVFPSPGFVSVGSSFPSFNFRESSSSNSSSSSSLLISTTSAAIARPVYIINKERTPSFPSALPGSVIRPPAPLASPSSIVSRIAAPLTASSPPPSLSTTLSQPQRPTKSSVANTPRPSLFTSSSTFLPTQPSQRAPSATPSQNVAPSSATATPSGAPQSIERARPLLPIITPKARVPIIETASRQAGPLLPPSPSVPRAVTPPGRKTLGVLKPRSGPEVLPGAYVCKCNAVGWTTPVGARYCEQPNRCDLEDPCSTKLNPDNICYPGRIDGSAVPSAATIGTFFQDYYCVCNGRGWYTPSGAQFCSRCDNPCWSNGDACASLIDDRNVCVWDFEGFFEAAEALLNPVYDSYLAPGVPANAVFASQFVGVNSPNPFVANFFTIRDGNHLNDYSYNQLPDQVTLATREGTGQWVDEDERNISKADVRKKPREMNFDMPLRRQNPFTYIPYTSSTLGPRTVPAGACGSYTCACNGDSWRAPVTGKYCTLCDNPCDDDPCNHEQDERNVCTYKNGPAVDPPNNLDPNNEVLENQETISNPFTGRRLMQSSLFPQNFLTSSFNGGRYTEPFPSSIVNDPNYRDPSVCGKNICQCDGVGWMVSLSGDRCVPCPDPCSNDPCQSFFDSENVCVSSFNTPDFYTAYFGTDSGYDLQELLSTLNPAIGTGTKECAAYVCVCGGENFAAGALRQSCLRCEDPCNNLLDPCKTARSVDNVCINVNRDIAFQGSGSSTTPVNAGRRLLEESSSASSSRHLQQSSSSSRRSVPTPQSRLTSARRPSPTNQVRSGSLPQPPANTSRRPDTNSDPSTRSPLSDFLQDSINARLQDILSSSLSGGGFASPADVNPNTNYYYTQPLDPETGKPITQFCGRNSCTCDGINWQLSPDSASCEPICSNRCALSDPCNSLIEPNNRCTFTPSTKSNTCGFYICTCYIGWRATFGNQGCVQLPQNACQRAGTDPCTGIFEGVRTGNICVLDAEEENGYRCVCNEPNWVLSDVVCVLATAEITRQRARQNRLAGGDDAETDPPTARPPATPCEGHDNCMVYQHPGNACVRSGPTSYQCKCNQPGYSASSTLSRCVPR